MSFSEFILNGKDIEVIPRDSYASLDAKITIKQGHYTQLEADTGNESITITSSSPCMYSCEDSKSIRIDCHMVVTKE